MKYRKIIERSMKKIHEEKKSFATRTKREREKKERNLVLINHLIA